MKDNVILRRAYEAWVSGEDFRERRERNKRFAYGDQWGDPSPGVRRSSAVMTEGERMLRTGRRPLTNNMIRQLVKTIVGRYRTMSSEAGRYTDAGSRRNSLGELDSRMLEEFLISGAAVQRVVSERRFEGDGVWVDNVDPRRFFVNVFSDPRGRDIELVGMLHDMGLPEIVSRYGRGNAERAGELARIFADVAANPSFAGERAIGETTPGADDFFGNGEAGKMRVIEVWTLDARPRSGGKGYDYGWRCRVFGGDGTLLDTFGSPYRHGMHPFVVKFYPLIDGEVHSFVEDLVENQKYINRLITLVDHVMASSAKGALLFPLAQKPGMVSLDEIGERWASPDALIPITGEGNVLPQQVCSKGGADGAYELLSLQMKLFENSSGVSDVLLGRNVSAAVGTENYRARVEASTIALADIFETFGSFRDLRDERMRRTGVAKVQK